MFAHMWIERIHLKVRFASRFLVTPGSVLKYFSWYQLFDVGGGTAVLTQESGRTWGKEGVTLLLLLLVGSTLRSVHLLAVAQGSTLGAGSWRPWSGRASSGVCPLAALPVTATSDRSPRDHRSLHRVPLGPRSLTSSAPVLYKVPVSWNAFSGTWVSSTCT